MAVRKAWIGKYARYFITMLAYYVEWHIRQRLAPLLFDDENPEAVVRPSVMAPAKLSVSAKNKARKKCNADGRTVHSFQTLMKDLATIARNTVLPELTEAGPFEMITQPTDLQQGALRLLEVD